MKITSEQIMNILDIDVGDYIIRNGIKYTVKRTNDGEGYILVDPDGYTLKFGDLVDDEFILHKPKKKVGETCCCDYMHCGDCPLCVLNCNCVAKDGRWPLYRLLNEVCSIYDMKSDNPIYKAFRTELDKEVE